MRARKNCFPKPKPPATRPLRFRATTTTTPPPPSFEGWNFCNCRNCSALNWRRSQFLRCGAGFKVSALGGLRHPEPRRSRRAVLVHGPRFTCWAGSTSMPPYAPSDLCWCAVQGWCVGSGSPSCPQILQSECAGTWCKVYALGCVVRKKATRMQVEGVSKLELSGGKQGVN